MSVTVSVLINKNVQGSGGFRERRVGTNNNNTLSGGEGSPPLLPKIVKKDSNVKLGLKSAYN